MSVGRERTHAVVLCIVTHHTHTHTRAKSKRPCIHTYTYIGTHTCSYVQIYREKSGIQPHTANNTKEKRESSIDRTACGSAHVNDTYAQRALFR